MAHRMKRGEKVGVGKRLRRVIAAAIGFDDEDLTFDDLDGPFYPEVVSGLLVLEDAETGKRFDIRSDGYFQIEDDTTVGRYLAFLPKKNIGSFNSGRFVLAAIKITPLYPQVTSDLLVLNTIDQGLRFKVTSGLMTVVDTGGLVAFLPPSGSKADIEMRFLFEDAPPAFGAGFGAGFE